MKRNSYFITKEDYDAMFEKMHSLEERLVHLEERIHYLEHKLNKECATHNEILVRKIRDINDKLARLQSDILKLRQDMSSKYLNFIVISALLGIVLLYLILK